MNAKPGVMIKSNPPEDVKESSQEKDRHKKRDGKA